MCVQDWLSQLRPGQSILILVPTSNYLQQWAGELCYKSIGLRLSPEMVFSGTPNQLERFQKRTGSHPAILLMTYTALSQAGSAIGKGGFDVDSIEMFLQGANVIRHPGRGSQGRRELAERFFRRYPPDDGLVE
jgi:hypothetical protein